MRHMNTFLLYFLDLPFFGARPAMVYRGSTDQSITLPCIADGDPKPVVTWRKVSRFNYSEYNGKLYCNQLAYLNYQDKKKFLLLRFFP